MNYPLRTGIIDYLVGRGTESLYYALCEVTANAPERVLHNQMNLLGTHDTERILTVLGDENVSGMSNHQLARHRMNPGRRNHAIKRLISAYTILATMPGIPTVFYGDEAGLEGYKDPFNRMPYPWDNQERRLVQFYRTMGRIRQENEVYKCGMFKLCHLDDQLLIFSRSDGEKDFVTVVNNADKEIKLATSTECTELITGISGQNFKLSSFASAVYKITKNSTFDIT